LDLGVRFSKDTGLFVLGLFAAWLTDCAVDGSPLAVAPTSVGFYALESSHPYDLLATANTFSDDGRVVAGHARSGFNTTQFIWRPYYDLRVSSPLLGYTNLRASAVSGDGSSIAGTMVTDVLSNRESYVYRWSEAAGYESLGKLSLVRGSKVQVGGANKDGSVVVGWGDTPEGQQAFRWTRESGMVPLGTLGTSSSHYEPSSKGTSVSTDGRVVAGSTSRIGTSNTLAAFWTPESGWNVPTPLPGTSVSEFTFVSSDGEMMVGTTQAGGLFHGILYDGDGAVQMLPQLPGYRSMSALCASDDGSLIGGWALEELELGFTSETVLWVRGGDRYQVQHLEDLLKIRKISHSGWRDLTLAWISPDGSMLGGNAFDERGFRRPYLIVLSVPEPSAVFLLFGLIGIAITHRAAKGRWVRHC
jgi:probable HAF family extracellular repeat protein